MKSVSTIILSVGILFYCSIGSLAQDNGTGYRTGSLTPEAEAYFMSLLPKKDSTYLIRAIRGKRNIFGKRFSLHTNMVDWLLLLPNAGVEFDINNTPRTHWSIMLSGRINPKTENTFGPRFVFNVNSVKLEGRKYWRTGRYGKTVFYHDDYVKLVTDSKSKDYNADSLESKFYNWYHKVRRNTFSGRTIENARNWRAYYVTMWASWDHYSLSLFRNGSQGYGLSFGTGIGYSIPLFPQRFPHEGSLDLDLGIDVGLRLTKYNAFSYDKVTGCYVYDDSHSRKNWCMVPFPVINDVHIGLVWRFRSIRNKVDLSLVDDYEKTMDAFKERQRQNSWTRDGLHQRNLDIADSLRIRGIEIADSTVYWDAWNIRRLSAARRLNPDTVFTGKDMMLELRLVKKITDPKVLKEAEKKYLKEQMKGSATSRRKDKGKRK